EELGTDGNGDQDMRYAALAVFALAGAAAPAALTAQAADPPAAQSVTLEQAVARALEHHPQAVQAEGAVRTAEAAEKSAFGAYLPTLSAGAGGSLSGSTQLGARTDAAAA